jgi:hypothetical protein
VVRHTIDRYTHVGSRATLQYGLELREGTERLLVGFPKLRAAQQRPPVGLHRVLGKVQAHRLYVGADEHAFVGPNRQLDGFHTAVEVIDRAAASLGVVRENVICIGTSMGAVCAMATGFLYGAGRIVGGAAPILCGTALRRFVGAKDGNKALAPNLLALAETADGSDPAGFLDGMLLDFALRCTSTCRVDLLTSPRDYAAPYTREFAVAASANRRLQVHVHDSDYGVHGGIGEAFFPFLRKMLGKQPRTLQA